MLVPCIFWPSSSEIGNYLVRRSLPIRVTVVDRKSGIGMFGRDVAIRSRGNELDSSRLKQILDNSKERIPVTIERDTG